ncbi:MAG: MBL fold metallo-hydrolase [Actinomycetota bacterium]|nr:MBL fold metallo-hydrolase [Actinomycetota bacterium]
MTAAFRRRALAIALVALSTLFFLVDPPRSEAKASLKQMIAARQRFFGKQNVNPSSGTVRSDRVILSWFSVANYAASFNGHVVLVDAWVARGSHEGYVPTTPEEVAALRPEYIFIGHGDFDHAADAAEIASLSGATIVGTPEHCASIRNQAGSDKIPCEEVAPEGAPPGIAKDLRLIPGVEVTSVTHLHSSFERPEQQDGGRLPCIPVWPFEDTLEHPPSAEAFTHLLRHLPDARGGNVLYQFRVGDFALAWHDTTGKINEDAPQAVKVLKTLPPTDVHFGAILAFGQVTNCFRSLRAYIDALSAKVFVATHHDNFTYFIGANAEDLEPYVREELARIPKKQRPKLIYTYDPKDYLNPEPFTFDPEAKSWK